MFSPTELDNVAWFLLLLIGAWLAVNALIDLSGDRVRAHKASSKPGDDRNDQQD